jgi:hypothetical protein
MVDTLRFVNFDITDPFVIGLRFGSFIMYEGNDSVVGEEGMGH